MSNVHTTYDEHRHCISVKEPLGNKVVMDCPYTGKDEAFSPIDLVESALGGCMLISMGSVAMRHGFNLADTRIDVGIKLKNQPNMHLSSIDVVITMPSDFSAAERVELEQAAESCPIKHSFADDIPIYVRYVYPQ